MDHFMAHRLRFVAEVVTPVRMNEFMGGSLRGVFFNALIQGFCMNRPVLRDGGCLACPLVQTCPVAFLAATLDPQSDRGRDVSRPYTIEPLLAVGEREGRGAGERFEFGLTMFARALNLFPYVVLSLERMGRSGIGRKVEENGRRRGTFRVSEVWAENPITGERRAVLRAGEGLVTVPDVPVTHAQVCALEAPRPGSRVRIDFLTPTRLIHHGQLVDRSDFRTLFQRLMERLAALAHAFSDTPLDEVLKYRLVGLAGQVRRVEEGTRWVQVEGYSSRQGGKTSISGILGHAVYQAEDWASFWPWLKWSELIHVGKNAVKGEGWLRVSEDGPELGY